MLRYCKPLVGICLIMTHKRLVSIHNTLNCWDFFTFMGKWPSKTIREVSVLKAIGEKATGMKEISYNYMQ